MKMILFIFAFLFLQSGYCDLTTKEMQSLEGTYSNKNGDNLTISFALTEENQEQPNLFGPEVINFDLALRLANYLADGVDSFEMTQKNFTHKKDGNYFFEYIAKDCDNPGCANFDVEVKISSKKNTSEPVKINIMVEADVEEIVGENLSEDEIENLTDETLGEFCAEYYGVNEAVGYMNGGYFCTYEIEIVLSKNN